MKLSVVPAKTLNAWKCMPKTWTLWILFSVLFLHFLKNLIRKSYKKYYCHRLFRTNVKLSEATNAWYILGGILLFKCDI